MEPVITTDNTPAQVDFLSANNGSMQGQGSVALRLLQSEFNINALRTNGVLRQREWIQYDMAVVEVARQRMRGVADLLGAGLRLDIANALGITRVEWERISDMTPAEISMSGLTQAQEDRPVFDLQAVPLPIIHKDFRVNIRALHASRNGNMPLDTTAASLAARLVSEKIEDMLFNGASLVAGGAASIYGYTTALNRNTGTNTNWANYPTVDGEDILADVQAMIGKAFADHMYGPYVLYVPMTYFLALGNDFKANSDKTVMQRLKENPLISDIRMSENLSDGASGEVLLVQMSRDVVDMVVGQQPTTIMWDSHGGMQTHFKVMALMVPRMKSDYTTQSGIVHYSI